MTSLGRICRSQSIAGTSPRPMNDWPCAPKHGQSPVFVARGYVALAPQFEGLSLVGDRANEIATGPPG